MKHLRKGMTLLATLVLVLTILPIGVGKVQAKSKAKWYITYPVGSEEELNTCKQYGYPYCTKSVMKKNKLIVKGNFRKAKSLNSLYKAETANTKFKKYTFKLTKKTKYSIGNEKVSRAHFKKFISSPNDAAIRLKVKDGKVVSAQIPS
ncbi:MAG: hypothetical protein U0K57_03120 [Lachnospiraceae bacterium]|nr:hypothetical protein [Lachnospiraceae bacterium]